VTVPAIEADTADVVRVAELNRLLDEGALVGVVPRNPTNARSARMLSRE
jgi:hypothetical protein